MTIHEDFESMVGREIHPDMRPELGRFLVVHAMVSEEVILDLEDFFRRNHVALDGDMSGMSWAEEQYGRVFDGEQL